MLDLAGYTTDQDLTRLTVAEPAAGDGAFVLPMATRLLEVADRLGCNAISLKDCIVAYELDLQGADELKAKLLRLFTTRRIDCQIARKLVKSWVRVGDYLLAAPHLSPMDLVVGNPPYVRLEDGDAERFRAYRRTYQTMRGRAGIHVGFFEAALQSLAPNGVCVFVCADQWMLNHYGVRLRQMITDAYSVETAIDLMRRMPSIGRSVLILRSL